MCGRGVRTLLPCYLYFILFYLEHFLKTGTTFLSFRALRSFKGGTGNAKQLQFKLGLVIYHYLTPEIYDLQRKSQVYVTQRTKKKKNEVLNENNSGSAT